MPPDFHYGFVQKAELVLDLEETGCESVKRRKEGVEDAVWDHPARDITPPPISGRVTCSFSTLVSC